MKRRDFLRSTLSLGAMALLPGTGLATTISSREPMAVQPESNCTPLIHAIRLEQVDVVKSLVRQGADVNERWGNCNDTPLHWACEPSALDWVKLMHFYNPDLGTRPIEEFYGYRLDHWQAGEYGDALSFLKSSAIDWQSHIRNDGIPFHSPSRIVRREIVKILADAGADFEARNNAGKTPLFYAARTSDIALLQYLFRLGADRTVRNKCGNTIAANAATLSDVKTMQFLTASGIDIHTCGNDGGTLLHYAARNFDPAVMQYLIDLGLDTHAKNINGDMPIHYAAWSGCVASVRYLVELGADVHAESKLSNTPLHYANDTRIVRFLLDAGADIGARDNRGYVPLHWAALSNHPGIAKLLLNAGCEIDIRTNDEDYFPPQTITPLHLAAWNGSTETANF